MKHQLWATRLTFAMFRVEKGEPVDQFILWFPEDMPLEVELSLLYQLNEQILFHSLEDFFIRDEVHSLDTQAPSLNSALIIFKMRAASYTAS